MALKNPTITKEQAKEELLRIVNLLGKTPTRNEFYENVELTGCHKTAIAMLFGINPYASLLRFSGVETNITPKEPTQEVECLFCKKIFLKTASAIRESLNHFCSKSCAASHNNKITKLKHGKNCSTKICKNCDIIHSRSSEFCSQKCKTENFMKNKTIKESLTPGERQQKFSGIRGIARNYAKYLPNKTKCQNCGYDKHVEIAHIKGISTFNEDDLLSNVNDENNLLALCPNCHWEFDNNILDLSSILREEH